MGYEKTLEQVRALSEGAVNHPLQRRVTPYRPPALKPAVRAAAPPAPPYDAPPPPRVVRVEFQPRPDNHERYEMSRIRGRTFVHLVSGKVAYYAGEDDRGRTLLDTPGQRYSLTEAERRLWWREETAATDHCA